ncbi:MAG: YcaO-like family protein [Janthinobacterium lividum]
MSDPGARYAAALSGAAVGRVLEFDLTPFDRTGVPVLGTVWQAEPGAGVSGHGVGYGADAAAARTGAFGELVEQVLLDRSLAGVEPRTAGYAELLAERGAERVADPRSLVLPAGCDIDPQRPLRWLATRRWRTGEEVLVPAEFVAPHATGVAGGAPVGGWLTTPITNGMGAGDTLERAVAHGLGELLQRDGNTVSFRALDTGVVITGLEAEPETAALLRQLAAVGLDVDVKLTSTEFAVVVHAVARDHDPATPAMAVTAIGEAAATDVVVAARKALLELASSRARRAFAFGPLKRVRELCPDYLAAELATPLPAQEPRALAEMARWTHLSAAQLSAVVAPIHRRCSSVSVADLPRAAQLDPAGELDELVHRLSDFDVLVASTRVEGPQGEVQVAKVVVPGLEVETLSYDRIGERVLRRLLQRGSPLVGRGAPDRPGRGAVRLTEVATEAVGGPAWFDAAQARRVVGDLYPLYREPTRHAPQRLGL